MGAKDNESLSDFPVPLRQLSYRLRPDAPVVVSQAGPPQLGDRRIVRRIPDCEDQEPGVELPGVRDRRAEHRVVP
jgi:hypothetical protein